MPNVRIQGSVSGGSKATKGAAVQATTDAPMVTPTSGMLEGHKPAPFDAVKGHTDGVAIHHGAPVASSSGPQKMPGSTPLVGHTFYSENPSKGNHPVRSKGKATQESDRVKLATAGS